MSYIVGHYLQGKEGLIDPSADLVHFVHKECMWSKRPKTGCGLQMGDRIPTQ